MLKLKCLSFVNDLEPQADPAPAVDSDNSDDDREIPLRQSTRVITPPCEWWMLRQCTCVIVSDSENKK